jgi:N-acyl amino acid synthase of PEP-CTERM/exosortase system
MINNLSLIESYQKYFYVVRADTPELLEQAFKLRYEVYINDCDYKFHNPYELKKIEKDSYDEQAQHCLFFHKLTNAPIAYVRLIPYCETSGMLLPIENFGIDFNQRTIRKLRTLKVGEVSRMSIHPLFRRRLSDQIEQPYNTETSNNKRCRINYLPMCLVLACGVLMFDNKLEYTVALMEKRLVILLKKYGVVYKQIGYPVIFNGIRAPYMIFSQQTYDNLSVDFKELFNIIQNELISSKIPEVYAEEK